MVELLHCSILQNLLHSTACQYSLCIGLVPWLRQNVVVAVFRNYWFWDISSWYISKSIISDNGNDGLSSLISSKLHIINLVLTFESTFSGHFEVLLDGVILLYNFWGKIYPQNFPWISPGPKNLPYWFFTWLMELRVSVLHILAGTFGILAERTIRLNIWGWNLTSISS